MSLYQYITEENPLLVHTQVRFSPEQSTLTKRRKMLLPQDPEEVAIQILAYHQFEQEFHNVVKESDKNRVKKCCLQFSCVAVLEHVTQ
jgi:hypothetical protein